MTRQIARQWHRRFYVTLGGSLGYANVSRCHRAAKERTTKGRSHTIQFSLFFGFQTHLAFLLFLFSVYFLQLQTFWRDETTPVALRLFERMITVPRRPRDQVVFLVEFFFKSFSIREIVSRWRGDYFILSRGKTEKNGNA